MSPVPFLDLYAQHEVIADEIAAGIADVQRSCSFVGGPAVTAFEEEFAAASGRTHCVSAANGTDALELALRAVGLGAGDEVVLPANTFVATAEAVVRAGGVPVLVDAEPETLLIDPEQLESAITRRTAAVVPVHLYGQIAPMDAVQAIAQRHGIAVVEDAAQAQGASQRGRGIGAGSAAASTSFYPGKNLGAYGDGGAVVSDRADVADRVRLLGNHGSREKYLHEVIGFNSRLDTIQAVVLRAKLQRLEWWNRGRRHAADRYAELLGDLDLALPVTAPGNVHVWHLYVVRVAADLRDAVVDSLGAQGIGTGIHYPRPVHLHAAFSHLGYRRGDFPVSESASAQMLSLPMFPTLTAELQQEVAVALRDAMRMASQRSA